MTLCSHEKGVWSRCVGELGGRAAAAAVRQGMRVPSASVMSG